MPTSPKHLARVSGHVRLNISEPTLPDADQTSWRASGCDFRECELQRVIDALTALRNRGFVSDEAPV